MYKINNYIVSDLMYKTILKIKKIFPDMSFIEVRKVKKVLGKRGKSGKR